eukprot:CAMPEP_0201514044 /NCGR_PEP_ID=MMETSP0161_2-20130828/5969_1 /ASSEMBLY_ACC=CAM_ASM_000251 /TAXON_ID=180227 /ORGANISM="Neoparamoeba aestuarina, Strain SoJaBio B1-5/56/2" /LENGTH=256 /DNA_ID=CAMNT_0047910475 /DNA_START=194 /DNA_END=960 /DNA_ORIENTATION=+
MSVKCGVNVLHALSVVGHIDEALIQKLINLIMKASNELPTTSVSKDPENAEFSKKLSHIDCLVAISSVAKLKIHNEEFVRHISELILSLGYDSEYSNSHIVLLINSFSRMGITHSVLVQVLMDRILTDEEGDECDAASSASDAATLLLALGSLQYTNSDVWDKLADCIINDVKSVSVRQVEDLCVLIQKMTWCNEKLLRSMGDHLTDLADRNQEDQNAPSVPPLVARLILDTFGMFLINHMKARRALSPIAAAAVV